MTILGSVGPNGYRLRAIYLTLVRMWFKLQTLSQPQKQSRRNLFLISGQSKIIITTVFRVDYMGALKKFTKQRKCDTYIKMLQRAHEFSANVYAENMDDMQTYLTSCKAFVDDSDVILKIVPR